LPTQQYQTIPKDRTDNQPQTQSSKNINFKNATVYKIGNGQRQTNHEKNLSQKENIGLEFALKLICEIFSLIFNHNVVLVIRINNQQYQFTQ